MFLSLVWNVKYCNGYTLLEAATALQFSPKKEQRN